jgi:hypothetical protein
MVARCTMTCPPRTQTTDVEMQVFIERDTGLEGTDGGQHPVYGPEGASRMNLTNQLTPVIVGVPGLVKKSEERL